MYQTTIQKHILPNKKQQQQRQQQQQQQHSTEQKNNKMSYQQKNYRTKKTHFIYQNKQNEKRILSNKKHICLYVYIYVYRFVYIYIYIYIFIFTFIFYKHDQRETTTIALTTLDCSPIDSAIGQSIAR